MAVAPGRMRNKWYPDKLARYATLYEVKHHRELIVNRDSSFVAPKRDKEGNIIEIDADIEYTRVEAPVQANVQLLSV